MKLLAVTIFAALNWYYLPDGSYRQLDDSTSIPGKLRGVLTNEAAAVAWQTEQAALAAAQAAAAASNAAHQASLPQHFPTGIEAAEITLNPYVDGHGYQFRRDSDGVIIGVESHSTKKTKAEIDAGEKAISDARKADRELIIQLIERRMDATNCNNVVTAANGQFTIYSGEIAQIRGATATSKQGNRWRGVTLIGSTTNRATFQVWSAAAVKAGAETNDWSIVLFK